MMERGDHVFGLETWNLPEGWTPLEAVVMVKCLDEDGRVMYSQRLTTTLGDMEALGMAAASHDMLTKHVTSTFSDGNADDPDSPEEG